MNKNLLMKITAGITAVFMTAACVMSVPYTSDVISAEDSVSDFIPGADDYRAIYVGDEDITFSSSVAYNATTAEFNDMWSRTATDYAYKDLALRHNGEGRQKLYQAIDSAMKSFWNSSTTLRSTTISGEKAYVIKTVSYTAYGLTDRDAIETYYMYKNDHPVAYYSSNNIYYNSSYLILTAPEYYKSSIYRKSYNKEIEKYIASYEPLYDESSEYKTALNFHDRICDTMQYAYTSDGTPEQSAWAHDIIGAVIVNSGVCETYARTYEMLLNYYGVENVFCAGDTGQDGHAWNMVKLDDGQYYYFDLTWDDFYNKSVPDYDYFAKGSINFTKNHFSLTPEGEYSDFMYALPEASLYDFVWTEPQPGTDEPAPTEEKNIFKNLSVTLNDGIVLNYFLDLTDELISDSTAYIKFTSDAGINRKIKISDGVKDDKGRYKYSLKLAPDQMADNIKAQIIYDSTKEGKSLTYSVAQYAQVLKNTCDSETAVLLDAMLNYGGAAQKYTGYNKEDTADRYSDTKSDESEIVIPDSFKTSMAGSVEGINFSSASLVAGSLTSIVVKFQLKGGKISDYTFACDDKVLEPVMEGDKYCVYIRDISPDDMDVLFNISVTDSSGYVRILHYSVFTYIKTILDNASSYDPALVEMMKELYHYNQAAERYVESRKEIS